MTDSLWWRDGVIYQIYPRSFADSNGDGIGDLQGIISRLDYLQSLGIDAIWLSPFYPSPDADFGYDISDHTAVDARFGTMEDFDALVEKAHQHGIRIILDLVLNHTSQAHPWFQESRSGRDNPKADWYIWRDTPNRWLSVFGGKAWTYDEKRGQYYYHMFLKEQPDVNWRNPDLRRAQIDVMRFWLARGVDGFRLDVFNVYFKDAEFRDNPPTFGRRPFEWQKHIYDCDRPELIPLLKEFRALMDSYSERYMVGETFLSTPEKAAKYCGKETLHAAFNFDFTMRHFHPKEFFDAIQRWERALGEENWPNYVLSNHDIPRSATRYAKGEDDARAKIVLAMLLTLRGTPYLYAGEEIGMRNLKMRRSEIMDPPGKRYYPFYPTRDAARSPMQWEDSPNAGFTTGTPWLRVHPNYPHRNVAAQEKDPHSILNMTKRLIALRKKYPVLRRGTFLPQRSLAPRGVMAYLRRTEAQTLFVALNFTGREQNLRLPEETHHLIFSTHRDENAEIPEENFSLFPYEAVILA